MNTLLIDTSLLIDFLRQKRKEETIYQALAATELYQFAIAMVTVAELYAGERIWKELHARTELGNLLSGLQILPLTTEIAQRAGELRAKQKVPILDALIAATAIEHGVSLATLDVADFKKIKGLKLFSL